MQFPLFLRTAIISMMAQALWGQNAAEIFSKAPPDVDDALRARITKFYQAQVDGKPRRAEDLVAEDSKDVFYSAGKPKMLSFEIGDIKYSDNFTKAKAMVLVEMYVPIPQFTKPMKVPGSSTWKIENGLWCWYIDPEVMTATPWGKMKGGEYNSGTGTAPPDKSQAPTVQSLMNQVRPDKVKAVLKAGEASSDQITIHNGMPGAVRIDIRHRDMPGLEIKVDRTEIPAGQNAIVSVRYEPVKGEPPHPLSVDVGIEPTNGLIQFQVTFN